MPVTLILLNGAPGVGKSTVAAEYVRTYAETVLIEIDAIRTNLESRQQNNSSKQTARDLAVEQIREHLRAGRDVILPQFVGRLEFIERLACIARAEGAQFREVVLTASADVIASRFRER